MRVYRPTATAREFIPIAEGGLPQTVTASSGLHTFPAQISVQTGDLVGIRTTDGPCGTNSLNGGDIYDTHPGTINPIGTADIYSEGAGNIYDISAALEPDCDKDGLGDETQDPNPSAVCPTTGPGGGGQGGGGANGQATKKKCKKKHKKHKRSAESAKKKKCKKKKKKH